MGQRAEIEWRNGNIPVSTRFDDPYFSLENGLSETAHVFLGGNDLPARFRDGFHVAELGFGTGLNLLAALRLWRETGQPGRLHFTSFEAYPMAPDEMGLAHEGFPGIAALARELREAIGSGPVFDLPDLHFELVEGDARETLPGWAGRADAWFLDGFAPAKNPQMWEPDLLKAVAAHTAPAGTAATYTAAGHVRRALADAGFEVERRPGYGRKRHMTVARKA